MSAYCYRYTRPHRDALGGIAYKVDFRGEQSYVWCYYTLGKFSRSIGKENVDVISKTNEPFVIKKTTKIEDLENLFVSMCPDTELSQLILKIRAMNSTDQIIDLHRLDIIDSMHIKESYERNQG